MHKLLYERQKDIKSGGVDAILGLALELGLDLDLLMDDMTSVDVRQHVANDMSEAERMGVRFTPNYFINNEHIGARCLIITSFRSSISTWRKLVSNGREPRSAPQKR